MNAEPEDLLQALVTLCGAPLNGNIADVNAERGAPTLLNPVKVYFGERVIERLLAIGKNVISIIYDGEDQLNSQGGPREGFYESEWIYSLAFIFRSAKRKDIEKLVLRGRNAMVKTLDNAPFWNLDPAYRENVQDCYRSGISVSPLELHGTAFMKMIVFEVRAKVTECY
jgi:hypothetical protein